MGIIFIFLHLSLYPSLSPDVVASRIHGRIQTLATFGADSQGGISRPSFTLADISARQQVVKWMKEAGLQIRLDAAANIIGLRPGRDGDLPPIVFGSHLDSVPAGGAYDGAAGVVAALEVMQVLNDNNIETRHPLEAVVFTDEEGSMVGSRSWSQPIPEETLSLEGSSGVSVREGLKKLGGDPASLGQPLRSKLAAYLELHIEQGARLFNEKIDIGIVEGIVGIRWWEVTIQGEANHAGTTAMDDRQDALVAASKFVQAVQETLLHHPGSAVGTVGRIEAFPGAPNVIPGKVVLSLELRDLSDEVIGRLFEILSEKASRIEAETGTRFDFRGLGADAAPALTSVFIRRAIEASSRKLGYSFLYFPSGAGHDAQNLVSLGPIGMIFVPSRGGISHSPREFTEAEALAKGTRVLLESVLRLDQTLER